MRMIATVLLACCATVAHTQQLRVGIIGTDSSHAVEFTRLLNDPSSPKHIDGARITAAYRGGSQTLSLSRDRIERFTTALHAWNIPFVDSIAQLCPTSDALLLLSVDPDLRRKEFEQAVACGKPIFVDKPLAPTYADALAMQKLAEQHHVAWFSASSLRYDFSSLSTPALGADGWGPGDLGENYALDLAWYGIHSIELLYQVMGPGVSSVSRTHTTATDFLTLTWQDGRIGSLRLIRPGKDFGIRIQTAEGMKEQTIAVDYAPLLQQIVTFFHTGRPPVANDETLEIFAVMQAAQQSLAAHGMPQPISRTYPSSK